MCLRSTAPVKPEHVRTWLFSLVLAIVFALMPLPVWFVEQYYSRGVYYTLQQWLTGISNVFPVAVLDLLILLAIVLTVRRVVRLFGVAKRFGVFSAAWESLRRLIRVGAWLTILFLWFWGFNYRRMPLEAALQGGKARIPTVEELVVTISDANALSVRIRNVAVSNTKLSYEVVASLLDGPFQAGLKRVGRPPLLVTGRPKYSLVLTPFFTWSGVTGMVNPVALESIVHSDLLPFERPFVLAHEWAHLAGLADEAEASAVGWLACMQGQPVLAYSASLYLIQEAGAALPAERWRDAYARLDPEVKADLSEISHRRQRENATIRTASTRVYDSYLKANRVDDGVASYSRALQLILSSPIKDALSTYVVR